MGPAAVVVAEISSMIVRTLVSGRPRQFIVMNQNMRCSILFHNEVPGGYWHTVIVRPVSAARRESSTFQARSR